MTAQQGNPAYLGAGGDVHAITRTLKGVQMNIVFLSGLRNLGALLPTPPS